MTFRGDTGFHPTVVFDAPYWVHDFTRPSSEAWTAPYLYSVGRYDERRPEMYTTELFAGVRNHHVGLDLGAPAGTPVFAFASGEVACVTINGPGRLVWPNPRHKAHPRHATGSWTGTRW